LTNHNLSNKPGDNDAFDLKKANILVTGGAGFIGSNFINYMLNQTDFSGNIINIDNLTYAGNLENLAEVETKFGGKKYFFIQGDICDYQVISSAFEKYKLNAVVHFAAETHVDRSIFGPKDFIDTNINGTFNLLESARNFWADQKSVRFHHISTDEVYGSLGETGSFYENTPYQPRSPYSASKASSDHLVRAYYHTYNLPISISNCSNNYGPCQFPEKLIPLMILNALEGKSLPVYGDGLHVRDWLHVEDHCRAIELILSRGCPGETYNIGGDNELKNLEIIKKICRILDKIYPTQKNDTLKGAPNPIDNYCQLITFVKDRPGHDRRYSVNCHKIKSLLGWEQIYGFEDGLEQTILWYLDHLKWVQNIVSGEYKQWIENNYNQR